MYAERLSLSKRIKFGVALVAGCAALAGCGESDSPSESVSPNKIETVGDIDVEAVERFSKASPEDVSDEAPSESGLSLIDGTPVTTDGLVERCLEEKANLAEKFRKGGASEEQIEAAQTFHPYINSAGEEKFYNC